VPRPSLGRGKEARGPRGRFFFETCVCGRRGRPGAGAAHPIRDREL